MPDPRQTLYPGQFGSWGEFAAAVEKQKQDMKFLLNAAKGGEGIERQQQLVDDALDYLDFRETRRLKQEAIQREAQDAARMFTARRGFEDAVRGGMPVAEAAVKFPALLSLDPTTLRAFGGREMTGDPVRQRGLERLEQDYEAAIAEDAEFNAAPEKEAAALARLNTARKQMGLAPVPGKQPAAIPKAPAQTNAPAAPKIIGRWTREKGFLTQ